MLAPITRFIDSCSRSWWKVLLLFIGQSAAMQVLNAITTGFPAISGGNVPFDMQNDPQNFLTPADVFAQLAAWDDQAFSDYYTFQAVDFAFPLLAGLFLASVFAFALRNAVPGWYASAVRNNLLSLLLLATVFDYLENINFLWVVTAWPEQAQLVAQLGILAKMGKLTCMGIGFALTAIFLLLALGRWLGRKAGLIKA